MAATKKKLSKKNILMIGSIILVLLLILVTNTFYNKYVSLKEEKEECEADRELSPTDDYKYNTVCTKMENNGRSSEGIILVYLYYSFDYNEDNEKAYAYTTNNMKFDNFENAKNYYFDNISNWMALDYQVELEETGTINLVSKYTTRDSLSETVKDLVDKGFECEKKEMDE